MRECERRASGLRPAADPLAATPGRANALAAMRAATSARQELGRPSRSRSPPSGRRSRRARPDRCPTTSRSPAPRLEIHPRALVEAVDARRDQATAYARRPSAPATVGVHRRRRPWSSATRSSAGDDSARGGADAATAAVFYYDLGSPYAYLAAERVNALFAEAGASRPSGSRSSSGPCSSASGATRGRTGDDRASGTRWSSAPTRIGLRRAARIAGHDRRRNTLVAMRAADLREGVGERGRVLARPLPPGVRGRAAT